MSATEQLDSHQGGPAARARVKLRNAFTPSQPVTNPRMFAGRGALLSTMIRAIEDQNLHIVLYGDRGIGKTSLLHVLARQATEARYLVQYSSCGEESDFSELFRAAMCEVPLLYHASYGPTSATENADGTLADLLPAGKVTPRQISDLLTKLTGTRLLIILDEFDRSPAGAFRRQVAELVKVLSDRSIRVQLVIAGVASNLTELVELIPSIRRNILGLPVPSMMRDEVGGLIRNGEQVSGMRFDDEVVEMITSLAAGSPYLASLLSQHAALAAVERDAAVVARQDIKVAISRAAEEVGDRITERSRIALERASRAGYEEPLALLAYTALQKGGRFDGEAMKPVIADREQRRRVLAELVGHGVIAAIEGDPNERHRFPEEGVPTYLWLARAQRDLSRD